MLQDCKALHLSSTSQFDSVKLKSYSTSAVYSYYCLLIPAGLLIHILQARGASAQPLLETLYQQTVVLVDELKKQSVPASLVLDVQGMCLTGAAAAASRSRKGAAAL